MTLAEAIQFAIRNAKPPAGVLAVTKAIEGALAEKSKSKRPTYSRTWGNAGAVLNAGFPPTSGKRSTASQNSIFEDSSMTAS